MALRQRRPPDEILDGPNSVGTPVAAEMPDPFGPRNRAQSGGAAAVTKVPAATMTASTKIIAAPAARDLRASAIISG